MESVPEGMNQSQFSQIAATEQTRLPASHASNGLGSETLGKSLGWFSVGLGVFELVAPGKVRNLVGSRSSKKLIRLFGAREIANGVGLLRHPDSAAWVWARFGGDLVDVSVVSSALRSPRSKKGRVIAAIAALGGVSALDAICARRLKRAPSQNLA